MVQCHNKPAAELTVFLFEIAACWENCGWFYPWIFEKRTERQIMDIGFVDILASDQAIRLSEYCRARGVSVDRKVPCGGTLKGEALNGV